MGVNDKIYCPMDTLGPYILEELEKGNYVKLTVSGNSMFPLFANRRDSVVLKQVRDAGEIKKFDIVFYRRLSGQYVLHRVLKKHKTHLIIAGDGETQKEYGVKSSQVFAKVVSFTRKGKEVTINSKYYKIYVFLWNMVFPLRYFILNIAFGVRRMLGGKNRKTCK